MKRLNRITLSCGRVVKTSRLPEGLKIAKTQNDLKRVQQFREKIFREDYPELDGYYDDPHDEFSIVVFTENDKGEITSTSRLIFENPIGFLVNEYIEEELPLYQQKGLKLVEAGRLAISEEGRKSGCIKLHYNFFHVISVENEIDSVVVAINENHVKFYLNRLGGKVLKENIENMNGSGWTFSCVEWGLNKTTDKFFKWIGIEKSQVQRAPYNVLTWNNYSGMFASIYTHYQREVYQETVQYLTGSVLDIGCGPARLAPLLESNSNISQYTGIEYAKEMFEIAEFTMKQLSKPTFQVFHESAENISGVFDTAVMLLSYYAMPNPIKMLKQTNELLKPDSIFLIANPNEKLDQCRLQKQVEKEMMWHPDYESFKQYNFEIADNEKAEFPPMNELLTQLQSVGFEIISCHQKFYEGGLNFVVCKKRSCN